MTLFSVVLATRDRPALFSQALSSVLAQEEADFEIIVVNDGSDPRHASAYSAIEAESGARVRFLSLTRRPNGHGQSYAINFGVDRASGEYVCFLDDDDVWTDPRHLRRAKDAIGLAGEIDLFMADQMALADGMPKPPPIWIEDLLARAPGIKGPDEAGCYAPSQSDLLRCNGFCHLNTTIVRRAFFIELKGLDEELRYENDRDFYLRAIDQAATMRYAPVTVSRHNVPLPAQSANMSTRISVVEKRLYQLRLLDKQIIGAVRPEIRQYARLHKSYTLQHLADELNRQGRHAAAAAYAREAVAVRPSARALATSILYSARAAMRRPARPTLAI